MDPGMQVALPILGIVAAAAVTFYAVSFSELREKSFRDLDESEYDDDEDGSFKSSFRSRERRARRKAKKEARD